MTVQVSIGVQNGRDVPVGFIDEILDLGVGSVSGHELQEGYCSDKDRGILSTVYLLQHVHYG